MACNILKLDLEIFKNKTETWTVTFSENNAAVDITDFTIYLIVKSKKSDADSAALITKTITSHSDAINGESEIFLSKADTNIAIGQYWYSIEYNNGETGDDLSEDVLQEGHLTIARPTRVG